MSDQRHRLNHRLCGEREVRSVIASRARVPSFVGSVTGAPPTNFATGFLPRDDDPFTLFDGIEKVRLCVLNLHLAHDETVVWWSPLANNAWSSVPGRCLRALSKRRV